MSQKRGISSSIDILATFASLRAFIGYMRIWLERDFANIKCTTDYEPCSSFHSLQHTCKFSGPINQLSS